MASGSNYLTTYYAKRIIGDTAAATSTAALLQTGSGITTNTWILHRTNRASTYGIHYLYDSTANGTADKIEFYGGQRDTDDTMDVASAWIQLDTGDASFNNIIGNGTLTINSTSVLYGNVVIGSTNPTANLLVYGNIQGKDDLQLFLDAAGRIASGSGPDSRVGRAISFKGTDDTTVAHIKTWIETNKDHWLQFTLWDNAGNYQSFLLRKNAPSGNTEQTMYVQWPGAINNSIFPKTTAGYDLGLRTNIWCNLWLRGAIKQIGTANAVKSSAIANNTSHLHFQDLEDINAINNHSGTPTESNRIFSIGSNFTVASSITTTYSYIRTYNWKNNSTENTYIRLSITNASTPTRHVYVNSSFEADGSIYSGTTNHENTHSIVARSKSGIVSIYSDYIVSTSNYSRGLYFGPNTIDDTTYAGYSAIASATDNTTTFRLYNANVNKYTTIIADGKDDYEGITYGSRQWTIPMANGNRIFVGTHPDNYPYNSMGVVYAVNGGSNASTYVLTTPRVKLYNHIQIATSRNDTNVDIRVTGLVIYGSCYGNTAAHLVSNTAGVFRYMDGGPQLIFTSGSADPFGAAADQPQIGALIFTDHDQAGTGVSFHFVSNQSSDNTGGNLTVTAPRFRARKGLTIGQNTDNTSYTLYVNGTITATNTIYANGGYLKSTMNGNTVTIGSQNTSFTHIYNSANIPFIFNKDVLVTDTKNLGSTSWPWGNLYIGKADGAGIYYVTDNYTKEVIRFLNHSADQYGVGLKICTGGLIIIGAGESGDTVQTNLTPDSGGETLYLASDGNIEFYPTQNSYNAGYKISMYNNRLWVGVDGNTSSEGQIGVRSGGGSIYLWSSSSTTGDRGLYVPAHGTGGAKDIIRVNKNNSITLYGYLSGTAKYAEYLTGIGRLNASAAAIAVNPSQHGNRVFWNIYDSTSRTKDATNSPSFDACVLNIPWDWGGYNSQLALQNGGTRIQIRGSGNVDNGENASPRYTPSYGVWREVVTATKATQIGSSTQPVYISNTGQATTCTMISSGSWKNGLATAFDGNGYGEIATGLDWHVPASTNDYDIRLDLDQTNKRLRIGAVGSGWNNAFAAGTFYGALSGNATSASKVGAGAATWMYFNNSNEVNFGGTNTSTTIYFGYRATDSRGKPTEFVFGSGNGTALVKCNRIIACSTTDAAAGSVAAVALITGDTAGTHIEMDNNEIIAKTSASAKGTLYLNESGYVTGDGKIYNAVWNDFAEYRASDINEPGRVVISDGKGKVILSTERLQSCAHVISDTYGIAVGESDQAKTPLGVAGRVLVIPYQDRSKYKIGDCLCTAPNGTADIMTREEIIKYPDKIIGIVDEIPDYESWNQTFTTKKRTTQMNTEIKGRIWIYIR